MTKRKSVEFYLFSSLRGSSGRLEVLIQVFELAICIFEIYNVIFLITDSHVTPVDCAQ